MEVFVYRGVEGKRKKWRQNKGRRMERIEKGRKGDTSRADRVRTSGPTGEH